MTKFRNTSFSSCDLCLGYYAIMLLPGKSRIIARVRRWDVATNDFQYGGRPPFKRCIISSSAHVALFRKKNSYTLLYALAVVIVIYRKHSLKAYRNRRLAVYWLPLKSFSCHTSFCASGCWRCMADAVLYR